jgi:cyclic beta-1,2-glucan synthetase
VSTVDSGNLAGALLALAEGLERVAEDPPLRPQVRRGLGDAAGLLADAVEEWARSGRAERVRSAVEASQELQRRLMPEGPCDRTLIEDATSHVEAIEAALVESLKTGGESSHDPALLREIKVWLDALRAALSEAQREARLSSAPPGGSGLPDDRGNVVSEAAALCARLRDIAARARALAYGMDFRFLYDGQRRLFSVGFDVTAGRLDPHHYDLLASEARLASFLAIVWRQVPLSHWFALGRPLTRAGRRGRALLSWGGSMFEYLMPLLLMRSHEDTLLHQSCEAAVDRQMAYGRRQGVPWGISESGYASLDGQQSYQYRAFGVPGLGMRRGLEEDVVVAPYASLLALPFEPRSVSRNLETLGQLGMLGRFGFFEAADFHPRRAPRGGPALVRSYMAHHQGMSLVAIDNLLCNQVMVDRFHADPHVKSGALLLDERVPVELPAKLPHTEAVTVDTASRPTPALVGWEPDRRSSQVWAVGNGTLTSFVTADGNGGLRWRDLAVNLWDPEPVQGSPGTAIWLVDRESGETVSGTLPPAGGWPGEVSTRFEASRVATHHRSHGLAVRTRTTVAAGDDVEVREIAITNEGDIVRRIRIVGALEPVLASHRDHARHPAFSKMFLRCSPAPELAGALVWRLEHEGAAPPVLLFRMVADRATAPRLVEIDRGAFLGRRGSYLRPALLQANDPRPAEQTLDPTAACAADLEIAPGSTRTIAFLTVLAPDKTAALELGRRFGTAAAVRWTFDDAARSAMHRVEQLGTPPHLLPSAQRLLSALLVPNRGLRAPEPMLASGRPSPPRLWGRGISGDEPIVLLRIDSRETNPVLDDVLAVHLYLSALGVRVDLVLLDDAPSGYGGQGVDAIRRLLAERDLAGVLHQKGRVHVVPADQARADDLADLAAAAAVNLHPRNASLAAQLAGGPNRPLELPAFTPSGPPTGSAPDPDLTVEIPKLAHDCGYGGFDGDDFMVRPGAVPPAPWCNVLANETFGCLVSEAALGSSWSLNARENRLTPWRNDPVVDPPSEVLYLRDEETGRVWSTTPQPAGVPTLVRHGQGYSTYSLACAGLEQSMTVFVPPQLPVKIARLRLRNATSRPRRLTATYYAEWVLGSRRLETRAHVLPEISIDEACVMAQTSWSMDFARRVAFLASDRALHGATADRVEMLGRGGDLSAPAALGRWGLSGRAAPGLDPCAALQVHVDLAAGEQTQLCFFLGQAEDRNRVIDLVRRLRAPGAAEEQWQATRAFWDRLLGAVRVRTPDAAFDRLCNRWLLYQSLASRFFGRTAFHHSSGAYGFRDQLQDSLAFIQCDPGLTRRHLLEAAAHQFSEGDVLHWWHPPGGAGVRTHCSDDLLWLVYATAEYAQATGDLAVLRERVPFLAGEPLTPRQKVHYARFTSAGEGTLLEHCRRALSRGFTTGPHGLPLIGHGDWNDGMDRVGVQGRGESVWLAWFVYDCTARFAALLEASGERDEARRWRERLPVLARALAEHGWDGAWYRRAYHDDGTPMGSARSAPPHIDSIAQSWAALSGAGDPRQVEQALASAERFLVREKDRLVLLLVPPFGAHGPEAGYIASYPPGVRENGGQYTHAAVWLGWAHAKQGDGNAAHRIFSLLNPLERTRSREEAQRYRIEPYVLAADVYSQRPWVGRGGWSWYTGAAGWMWRLGVEEILGLRRRGGALEVDPSVPSRWKGFEAWVREGELMVHVVVDNTSSAGRGVTAARLDGRTIDRARVELSGAGERRLEVWLGGSGPSHSNSSSPH